MDFTVPLESDAQGEIVIELTLFGHERKMLGYQFVDTCNAQNPRWPPSVMENIEKAYLWNYLTNFNDV